MKEKDYRKYKFRVYENIGYSGLIGLLLMGTAYLFYEDIRFSLLLLPVYIIAKKRVRRWLLKKQKTELMLQFKDALRSMQASVAVGYSFENSIREAKKELEILYGSESNIVSEFSLILEKRKLNIPVEKSLVDFADRSDLEVVRQFSQVFTIIERTGGNMKEIMETTIYDITEKITMEREMEIVLSGKKYEHRVMVLIPILMIFMLKAMMPGFLNPLYNGSGGNLIMTAFLLVYFFAIMLSEHLMDIEF